MKEKIIYDNTKTESFEKGPKEGPLEKRKPETVKDNKIADLPQLPLQNLQLDTNKCDAKKDVVDKGNHFLYYFND